MHYSKAKLLPLILLPLLLCGCAEHSLSGREIVRAAFFAQERGNYSVCLLLENQDSAEGGQTYKTVMESGATAEQALRRAERSMKGEAYYGLMDLAALPHNVTFEQAREIGTLLYESTQPSPAISVFVLNGWPAALLQAKAGTAYEDMKSLEKEYGLHCGLQTVFTQSGLCAFPCWQNGSYGMLFLSEQGKRLLLSESVQAQFAAVLCGKSSKMKFEFSDDSASFQADCHSTVQVGGQGTAVQLHLNNEELELLKNGRDEETARTELRGQWQDAFMKLAELPGDPLRLNFWAACRNGPGAQAEGPELQILSE